MKLTPLGHSCQLITTIDGKQYRVILEWKCGEQDSRIMVVDERRCLFLWKRFTTDVLFPSKEAIEEAATQAIEAAVDHWKNVTEEDEEED